MEFEIYFLTFKQKIRMRVSITGVCFKESWEYVTRSKGLELGLFKRRQLVMERAQHVISLREK